MDVCVAIELSVTPGDHHVQQMKSAALYLTDDKSSVQVKCPPDSSKQAVAQFTIPKARQMDVVDRIGKAFWCVEDYQNCRIWFPQPPRRKRRTSGSSQ
jgi:hypothetical protein